MFNMSLVGNDANVVVNVVNQGIDARLTAFTKSTFDWSSDKYVTRLNCEIDQSEMEILIRRLLESDNEDAEMLADDIVYVEYGYETI